MNGVSDVTTALTPDGGSAPGAVTTKVKAAGALNTICTEPTLVTLLPVDSTATRYLHAAGVPVVDVDGAKVAGATTATNTYGYIINAPFKTMMSAKAVGGSASTTM